MDFGPPDHKRRKSISGKRQKQRTQEDLRAGFDPGRVKPDWREYFIRFVHAHGGNEVEIGGRLVLPDGWSYSSTSYAGPEYPPPAEPELTALLISYWTERSGIVRDELKLLKAQRQGLLEQYGNRSMPVPRQVMTGRDETTGVVQWGYDDVTTSAIDVRMDWLASDAVHCAEMVKNLNERKTEDAPA